MEVNFEKFIKLVESYNPSEVEFITKAYEFAKKSHDGQIRQSGEPYITHPLAVANILANMHADKDTVCAGLLHDVIEDCDVSKDELSERFNPTIAELVDGVTNLTKVDFKNKTERTYATKRKIILGITKDARIIIIKLADRLHNMSTLQYKSEYKRIAKATETMQFYVPLARYIGAEKLRRELEDLSFQHLSPQDYIEIKKQMNEYINLRKIDLNNMFLGIAYLLKQENISYELKSRIKNAYSVYRRVKKGESLYNLHDFIAIKVLVNDVKNCYDALRIIHSLYPPSNGTFKDYICKPKTNMYSSLHTSVFGPNDLLVQTQIRTKEMEKINLYGLTAYWDICRGEAGNQMQKTLQEKFQFVKSINEINRIFDDNQSFVKHIEREILGENIYVYNYDGTILELPEGSTVIDFAYRLGSEIGNQMVSVYVNSQNARFDTVLHTGERVHIITNENNLGPKPEWINDAVTIHAQRAIRKSLSR